MRADIEPLAAKAEMRWTFGFQAALIAAMGARLFGLVRPSSGPACPRPVSVMGFLLLPCGGLPCRATFRAVDADTLTIIGAVLAVGLALAGLSLRTAARQDRRMDRFEAAMAAHRDRFEDAMATHRTEMHRLAERQSHVEGGLDEPGAADDRSLPSGDAHGRPGPNHGSKARTSSGSRDTPQPARRTARSVQGVAGHRPGSAGARPMVSNTIVPALSSWSIALPSRDVCRYGVQSRLVEPIRMSFRMGYQRTLLIDLPPGQSAFLWGARQTGKSTLLRERFPDSVRYDLLDSEPLLRFTAMPSRLGSELQSLSPETLARPVVLDEIQKVPALLDEVHRLIETRGLAFVLCGSSARKLRRTGTNLLGGRAWRFELFPLTWVEVPDFDLLQALNRGLLPGIHPQRRYRRSLAAYVRDYLTQEVFHEALTRNAASFSRFFDALAFCHGELLNYAAIARDCAIDAKTVRTYFEILTDTLVGHLIHPFHRPGGRQSISAAPKFYLFDLGVAAQVCRRTLTHPAGREFGRAFEHFILLELVAARSYQEKDHRIEFWRTKSGLEVDFVLDRGAVAIEAKGRVHAEDLRSMRAFRDEFSPRRAIVVTAERDRRTVDGIEIMPYPEFLESLHRGHVI